MRMRLIVLLVLLLGLTFSFGCSATQTGFAPEQNLRRVMIAGEQVKLVGADVQNILGLEQYPQSGRYNY